VPDYYRALVATAGGAGLRWGEAAGLCLDALGLDAGSLKVIRTVVEVSGNTAFKPFPRAAQGVERCLFPRGCYRSFKNT
jgi:hypothetical protein